MTNIREKWLQTIRKWQLHIEKPGSPEYWAPQLDTCSREKLKEIQSEKLRIAVCYMYEYSGLFRRKCQEKGITPEDIRNVEDLSKLPIITKQDMSEDLQANPPWGTYTAISERDWIHRGWQVFQTSGTTAVPRPFPYTQFDRQLWTWTNARALYAMGIRNGQDIAMLCFGYGPHVAMWGMHYALNAMGVPIVPAGGLDTRTRAYLIHRYRPTLIAATPSYALHLGSVMRELGYEPGQMGVRRIICLGEPLPPASAQRIATMWNAEIHQFYGCTEAAPSCGGYTCTANAGLHFMEDTHILELVDPETLQPVPPGSPGASVVTNLCSEASPQIRFLVGDFARLTLDQCSCGRTHVRAVEGFSGRADDMLNIRGITLFPSAIEEIVRSFPELGNEFQIVIETIHDLDELKVVVEPLPEVPDSAYAELTSRLESAIRAQCELRATIELKPYGSLPKTEFKAKRVVDLRRR